MTAWDFPAVIVAAVVAAVAVGAWLIRVGQARSDEPDFACKVCGRKQLDHPYAKQWRYCPYCGVPRGATSTRALPRNLSRHRQ